MAQPKLNGVLPIRSNGVTVITEKLEKPAPDNRLYRVIVLPNKMEVLLICDPETDKASAALDVNVGSFSDPVSMPGLAHAVEHMLFMGTKKVCWLIFENNS
jgi:insulysin